MIQTSLTKITFQEGIMVKESDEMNDNKIVVFIKNTRYQNNRSDRKLIMLRGFY